MAIVADPRWRAFDALGNAYSGALLYVVDAGTSTPSTIYTDAALTIPAANPVAADSNGIFPQWFGPEATLYDLQMKTSGGVLISGRSYVSVPAVGNQTGALTRDFTTSRFQARGAGGTTYIEVGDASPDNVGGTGLIGGWNGTQADTITINAALANVTGRLKENSKKLANVVYTEATAFSGTTSVVIALPNDPVGVRGWQIDIIDFAVVSADDSIRARFSYDGGATYKSGATDYSYYSTYSGGVNNITGDAEMALFTSIKHTSVPKGRATIRISSPLSTDAVVVAATAALYAQAGGAFYYTAAAFGLGGYGRPTHLKLFCNTSTISGLYRMMPERGFGDA